MERSRIRATKTAILDLIADYPDEHFKHIKSIP